MSTTTTGELRGVRETRDKLIAQEMAGRPSKDLPKVQAQLDRVVKGYDRSVREGREPLPKK